MRFCVSGTPCKDTCAVPCLKNDCSRSGKTYLVSTDDGAMRNKPVDESDSHPRKVLGAAGAAAFKQKFLPNHKLEPIGLNRSVWLTAQRRQGHCREWPSFQPWLYRPHK